MRLSVCSNSAPARPSGPAGRLATGPAGGLVPHALALLEAQGGDWFFPQSPADAAGWPDRVGAIALHPVALADELRRPHYETVSIETLLWLFHYLHETVSSPVFDARLRSAWAAYREVNARFAACLTDSLAARRDENALVLVNDYPLLLVPGAMSRQKMPDGVRVVYVHHVPWCEADYFGILPGDVRQQILTSLLACDTVAFHTERWLQAFSGCCDRYVPGADVRDGTIEYRGRSTRLRAQPYPLDTETVLRLQREEATQRWRRSLIELAGGRRLLVRADRLDLWKNHLRGLAAFRELLHRRPALKEEVCFVTVQAPVRYQSARHRAYAAACRAMAAEINEAAAGPDPVAMLEPAPPAETRHRALAAMIEADAMLINPTYDGFNLVAKEAALLAEDAPILLSRNAGAHEYLASAVLPLDPFDVTGTAETLDAALHRRTVPDRAAVAAVRDGIHRDSAVAWLAAVTRE